MKTVMIVDDSATMLMSVSDVLNRYGFKPEKASSGEDAMKKLKSGASVDLIITDYHMPGMNGIDLIREARKLPAHRFTPILMLTTESQQEKRDEAKKAGATGWLVKPVDPPTLKSVLERLLPGQ